jgi:hypothetical protein
MSVDTRIVDLNLSDTLQVGQKPWLIVLPISPMSLTCPLCNAKPGKACNTSSRTRLEVVHLARIKAPAKSDQIAADIVDQAAK